MSTESKERVVGVALCGFGRAGRIHFNGIRQNRHCELKYVVDLPKATVTVGDSTLKVGDVVRSVLAEHRMEQAKIVDGSKFREVSFVFDSGNVGGNARTSRCRGSHTHGKGSS